MKTSLMCPEDPRRVALLKICSTDFQLLRDQKVRQVDSTLKAPFRWVGKLK